MDKVFCKDFVMPYYCIKCREVFLVEFSEFVEGVAKYSSESHDCPECNNRCNPCGCPDYRDNFGNDILINFETGEMLYKCMTCHGSYWWKDDGHTKCKLCNQERRGY